MSTAELRKYTEVSRYAGYLPEKKRRENWKEMVTRVTDMHREKYREYDIKEIINSTEEALLKKLCLGSQRALQFGGSPILKKNARIYNCSFSYCDRPRFFQEAFWLLLCGCGTGFSVQKHHIAKLPKFTKRRWASLAERRVKKTFIIPDSIEGWSDALGVLLYSYFDEESEWRGYYAEFDYSLIRPKGTSLSSSSGKAPGPEPLERALEKVRELLDNCIANKQSRLEPINAYDIIMHISDAVLSGGHRRSATICLFSPDDEEMAKAKIGNWFIENPQRGRSNNSALLVRNKTTEEEFNQLMQWVKEYGEPGFIWADSEEFGVNPCSEIGFYSYSPVTGLSGWGFCNLCEINGKKCKTLEDFKTAGIAAARLGTLQAGYTDFSYLETTTEEIVRHEALLGISITGMMDNPDILFNPENQRLVAQLISEENERVAKLIGINPAARLTCVKPAGTTSCLLGSSSGIHPHHYTRYFRRVQSNKLEAPFQYFKSINPTAVENSVWDPNGMTGVITFCVEIEPGAKTKNQLSAIQMLEYVKNTYENWVLPGTRKERGLQPWLTHSVSNTITVKPDEWDAVSAYIYENRHCFAGISLLPATGDKDYPQAPFCSIYSPKEMINYYGDGVVLASGVIEGALNAFDNNLWEACDVLLFTRNISEWPYNVARLKNNWIEKAQRFAERYFDGDIKKMTHCLKDVHNWKLWLDLKREYKPVDYGDMVEEENNIDHVRNNIACAGGQCML